MISSDDFFRDGGLVVRGLLSGSELNTIRDHARRLQDQVRRDLPRGTRYWDGPGVRGDDISPERKPDCTWGVNEIDRPELFDPVLVNVLGRPRVLEAMESLLGPEIRVWGIKMLWAPRLTSYDLHWHRDQVKRDLYDFVHHKPAAQDHIQFNLALEPDDSFIWVPGSHRRPLTSREWDALSERPPPDLPGQQVAELGPGDAVFMDAHALHRGRCPAGAPRLSLHYSAQAQWVPFKAWDRADFHDWITSEPFLSRLDPPVRRMYERMAEAETTDDSMSFLKAEAARHGWSPAGG